MADAPEHRRRARRYAKHCDYCAGTGRVPCVPDYIHEFYHYVACSRCTGCGEWCHWHCATCNVTVRQGVNAPFHTHKCPPMEPMP